MQAKPLHEVLARVVAWHNRHPLALRISPSQVHSIGGVALPFASAVAPTVPPAPPTLHDVLDAPATDTDADAAFASFVAGTGDAGEALTPATEPGPPSDTAKDMAARSATVPATLAVIHTAADSTTDSTHDIPAGDAASQPPPAPEPEPAPDAGPPASADTPESAALGDDATPEDDAPIELAMALDEAAAQADAEAAAALAQTADASEPAGDDTLAPPAPDTTPFTGTETQVLPAPTIAGSGAAGAAVDVDLPSVTPADAEAPLAARLQAARERAMAGAADGDGAGVDIALDGPPAAAHAPAGALALPATTAPRSRLARWLAALWAGLPLGLIRRGQTGQAAAGRSAGGQGKLAPLFSQDFMWPRTPRQVARWVQRHGADSPLAPADWPQRQVDTDAALLQAARRQGLPHAVTRHVLTAAIGVGDRRIRLLIDEQGRILGPRAFDRRRIGLLGSTGAMLAAGVLVGVLGPWRQAAIHPDDAAAAAAQAAASAASAALADAAASAAPAAMAAASAASDAAVDETHHAAHGTAPETHAAAAAASAVAVAAAASATGHGSEAPADAHAPSQSPLQAATHGSEAAPALAAASAPGSVVTLTQEPPPRWPVTRASGPLVAIRPRLSDEAKAAARAELAAARAATGSETQPHAPPAAAGGSTAQPVQGPGTPPRLGPQETAVRVAQQPGMVYAVVTPAMPQRESAEAILAQMMSVRARIPPPVPDHGEVMAHQGRWRAAWWPFATQADAERARAMLVARGMRAEIIEF